MDKKEQIEKNNIIDDKEDLEIKNIAYEKENTNKILLYFLIFLFCIMLGMSMMFISGFYKNKVNKNNPNEVIEIKSNKNNVLITNLGEINQKISSSSFSKKEDLKIENINVIELTTNSKSEENGKITFNVKYDIFKNDFRRNEYATNKSDVLVKFSYSFDNQNWTYVNNVVSTLESTLSPLMGNFYDISGLVTTLNIATNYEISSKPGETIKMYWRSETIFKYNEKIGEKTFNSNFKIEYKNNT